MVLMLLKILGGVLALGLGLYLGGAGQYRADPKEIDQALSSGGRSQKAKRHFTPMGWLRQTQERSSHLRRRTRGSSSGRFNLSAPDSKKD